MRAYLSLGSNLGDRRGYLSLGVQLMTNDEVHRVSNVYQSEPVGGVVQDDFWNLVVELETDATPHELLARAQRSEAAAQRVRDVRWGPRTLDVDIVWIDAIRLETVELTVPHPRMRERTFVLVPLRELRADLVTVQDVARAEGAVRKLGTLESLL